MVSDSWRIEKSIVGEHLSSGCIFELANIDPRANVRDLISIVFVILEVPLPRRPTTKRSICKKGIWGSRWYETPYIFSRIPISTSHDREAELSNAYTYTTSAQQEWALPPWFWRRWSLIERVLNSWTIGPGLISSAGSFRIRDFRLRSSLLPRVLGPQITRGEDRGMATANGSQEWKDHFPRPG